MYMYMYEADFHLCDVHVWLFTAKIVVIHTQCTVHMNTQTLRKKERQSNTTQDLRHVYIICMCILNMYMYCYCISNCRKDTSTRRCVLIGSYTVPGMSQLEVTLSQGCPNWKLHCPRDVPISGYTVPGMSQGCPNWKLHCSRDVPIGSYTVPGMSQLVVTLSQGCPNWKLHCPTNVPISGYTVPGMSRLEVTLSQDCRRDVPIGSYTVAGLAGMSRLEVTLSQGCPNWKLYYRRDVPIGSYTVPGMSQLVVTLSQRCPN